MLRPMRPNIPVVSVKPSLESGSFDGSAEGRLDGMGDADGVLDGTGSVGVSLGDGDLEGIILGSCDLVSGN